MSRNRTPTTDSGREPILEVLSGLEEILSSSPYAANFRPVLKAARSGVITRNPAKLHCYLYGAIHASLMDDETWELVDAQLDQLLKPV